MAVAFVVWLGVLVRRSAASGQRPQVVLAALPMALLFVPVQTLVAGIVQVITLRGDRATAMAASSVPAERGEWGDAARLVSSLLVLPVWLVALFAQRIEAVVMAWSVRCSRSLLRTS